MSIKISDISEQFGLKNPAVREILGDLTLKSGSSVAENAFCDWKALVWKSGGIDPETWGTRQECAGRHFSGIFPPEQNAARSVFIAQTYFASLLEFVMNRLIGQEQHSTGHAEPNLYNWFRDSGETEKFLRLAADFPWESFRNISHGKDETCDIFGALYRQIFPRILRKQLGEFYTPVWLAEYLLDISGFAPSGKSNILDPACGSGVFLLAAQRRMQRANVPPKYQLRRLCGFDLNPLAVLITRANFAFVLTEPVRVLPFDSIRDEPQQFEQTFDLILGNPPWLNWDKLSREYRESTQQIWRSYGFFSLSGKESRYGGAKKELGLLMLMRTADRFLCPNGKLAMVVPQSVFQTGKAGEGFRRFNEGTNHSPLKVEQVDDFSAFPVFEDTAVKTATILIQKSQTTIYPVVYNIWKNRTKCEKHHAFRTDPEKAGSPWRIVPLKEHVLANRAILRGKSDYTAILGANTGGANGVFWVEILKKTAKTCLIRNLTDCGRKTVEAVTAEIESELLYPLLRWKDVDTFSAKPSCWVILTQDPKKRIGINRDVFRTCYPLAWNYFGRFRELLENRAAYRKYHPQTAPFYSMYNVCIDTLAPVKVIWRRMDSRIRAAMTELWNDPLLGRKPVIPQETCSMIAVETMSEAKFLANLLNSRTVGEEVASFSVTGSKGFGSPGFLRHLSIPRYQPASPLHRQLCQEEPSLDSSLDRRTEDLVYRILCSSRMPSS
ncbi:MAG: SAM-dependent methyltransferase [Planctomycetaceae bacterium]|jgi:hypothetical protein|nr:SAM-dependent methyltransferase [Planctomycetaceae bacterium]